MESSSNRSPGLKASRPITPERSKVGKRRRAVAASSASSAARLAAAARTSGRLASNALGKLAGAFAKPTSGAFMVSAARTCALPWAVSVTSRPMIRARSLSTAAKRLREAFAALSARTRSKPGARPARSRTPASLASSVAAVRSSSIAALRASSVRQSITLAAISAKSALRTPRAEASAASIRASAARSCARRRPKRSRSHRAVTFAA